jgi:[protein-PII] uridylyltransferase
VPLPASIGSGGRDFCEAWTAALDSWFGSVAGQPAGVAVLAVGGYGRREMCPQSDIDVLVVHKPRERVDELAASLWYPLWDAGLRLGNGVRTVKETLALAEKDLDSATTLLGGRVVAGDIELGEEVLARASESWARKPRRAINEIGADAMERRDRFGEVAFLLEPDLKSGRGGLRDHHGLQWLAAADARFAEAVCRSGAAEALDLLLAVRVELHRVTARRGDRFLLQDQDEVASRLGRESADELARDISRAARTLAWALDDTLRRARAAPGARAASDRLVDDDIVLRDGEVVVPATSGCAENGLVVRVAAAAASLGVPVAESTLRRLAADAPPLSAPWPDATRSGFVRLLGSGPAGLDVIESLDQHGLMERVLPEWAAVRHRPQRNVYHRFTVDRHLCEAAAEAAALAWKVGRPDLLVVGAFLHDIGKGFDGDHTEVGELVVEEIGPRMGFSAHDVEILKGMVRHHLLLPDVATRRDLDDPATITAVATAVGSVELLDLLHALTEADSRATGPQAWSRWKAELVADLVRRVRVRLEGGGEGDERGPDGWVTADHRRMMEPGVVAVMAADGVIRVAAPDRPGLFSRVAGAVALQGLDVLAASAATSVDGSMAIEELKVAPSLGREPDWEAVAAEVEQAILGRVALGARLEDRARTYARPAAPSFPPRVLVDLTASATSTVMEVRTADRVGVLYAITRALADCDLGIRSAKVQTLGHEVIDTFYLRAPDGSKPTDPTHLAEAERAVLAALRD